MAEYVEKKAVLDELERVYNLSDCPAEFYNGYRFAMRIVKGFKKADVAPVRHGKWLKAINNDCEMHQCDQCGARVVKGLYEYENPNRFCYHCGARMDGGAGNGE